MQRRDFLLNSCRACAAVAILPAIASLEGCASSKALVDFTEADGRLRLPVSAFATTSAVTVMPKSLTDPLMVAKTTEGYSAFLLHCPHKGGPVSDTGGVLTCAWHGSTFDAQGKVTHGPAKEDLKHYPTREEEGFVVVTLAAAQQQTPVSPGKPTE